MTFILKPGQTDQLQRLLNAESEHAKEMMEILQQEHHVLVQGEAEAIREVSGYKQALARQMARQVMVRDRFLTDLGLPAGKEGTDNFVEYALNTDGLKQSWNEFKALAQKLNDQNEINGGIVSIAQRHVREALNILTGQNEQGSTYGPGGVTPGHTPHSLAKA